MRVPINNFTSENQYKVSGGQTSNNYFAGNCGHKLHNNCYYLFSLDEADKALVANIKLKENEVIYRAETDRSRLFKQWHFVKINLERGLIYFTVSALVEEEIIEFETRGVQLTYLNLKL